LIEAHRGKTLKPHRSKRRLGKEYPDASKSGDVKPKRRW